jgi:hypothetical protein
MSSSMIFRLVCSICKQDMIQPVSCGVARVVTCFFDEHFVDDR